MRLLIVHYRSIRGQAGRFMETCIGGRVEIIMLNILHMFLLHSAFLHARPPCSTSQYGINNGRSLAVAEVFPLGCVFAFVVDFESTTKAGSLP